jgi:hypothetical protein
MCPNSVQVFMCSAQFSQYIVIFSLNSINVWLCNEDKCLPWGRNWRYNICDSETKIIKTLSWLKRFKYIFQGLRKFALTDVMDFVKRSLWKTYRLAKRERMPSRDKKYVRQATNFAVKRRLFVFRLSVRRIGFGPKPFHAGYVVNKFDTGTVFFVYFGFSSLSFQWCSLLLREQ